MTNPSWPRRLIPRFSSRTARERQRLRRLLRLTLLLAVVALAMNCGPAAPNLVLGNSMAPTILHCDLRLLDRMALRTRGVQREDVVVVKHEGELLTKRLRGVPGDTMYEVWMHPTRYAVLVSEPMARRLQRRPSKRLAVLSLKLREDEYYVTGDNPDSFDSREFGPVNRDEIVAVSRPFSWESMSELANEIEESLEARIEEWTEAMLCGASG